MQIPVSTINRDVLYLRSQAKENIRKYVDERLPEEYGKCLVGITSILREAWTTSNRTEDNKEKIQALSLAKECYSMKLDLLTNATVVNDAIRFVSQHNNIIKNEKVTKIDNDSELLHNAAASADAVTTTNKVF